MSRSIRRMRAEFALMKQTGINTVYFQRMSGKEPVPAGIRLVPASERKSGTYLWSLDSMNEAALSKLKDPAHALIAARRFDSIAATQEEPGIFRFCAGVFLWRLKAGGCFFKVWRDSFGEPYHPFDYHCGEFGDLADPAGHDWPTMNSSVQLEGAREGILDYRYLMTLERLLREKPGHAAAGKARAYLKSLEAAVVPDAAHYFTTVGRTGGWDNTWHQKPAAWKGADFEKMREELAEHIAALEK